MVEQLLDRSSRSGLFNADEIAEFSADVAVWTGTAQDNLFNITLKPVDHAAGQIQLHQRMPLADAIGLPKHCRNQANLTAVALSNGIYHQDLQTFAAAPATIASQFEPRAVRNRARILAGDQRRLENVERVAQKLGGAGNIWTIIDARDQRTNDGLEYQLRAARLAGLAIEMVPGAQEVVVSPVVKCADEALYRLTQLGSQYEAVAASK